MKVLFIDPNILSTSPSMKGIVSAIPYLQERGWEIELWCCQADESIEGAVVRKFPAPRLPGPLPLYYFGLLANLKGLLDFFVLRKERPTAVHATGFYYLGADFTLCQFSPWDWFSKQLALGIKTPKQLLLLLSTACGGIADLMQLWSPFCPRAIAASDAVADDFRRLGPKWKTYGTLANAFDPERFGVEVRERWRSEMRSTLGFAESDVVFSFVSAGHYRRKGLWLALRALGKLRAEGMGNFRFLIVGGTETAVGDLRKQLTGELPDFEEWVTLTGMVTQVERYLSASDGFLFPSYSEAFANVEIEASALGIPLFLTPHHGSEMILEDGVNGRSLPFDVNGIAEILREEIEKPVRPGTPQLGRALSLNGYVDALEQICLEVGGDFAEERRCIRAESIL